MPHFNRPTPENVGLEDFLVNINPSDYPLAHLTRISDLNPEFRERPDFYDIIVVLKADGTYLVGEKVKLYEEPGSCELPPSLTQP